MPVPTEQIYLSQQAKDWHDKKLHPPMCRFGKDVKNLPLAVQKMKHQSKWRFRQEDVPAMSSVSYHHTQWLSKLSKTGWIIIESLVIWNSLRISDFSLFHKNHQLSIFTLTSLEKFLVLEPTIQTKCSNAFKLNWASKKNE